MSAVIWMLQVIAIATNRSIPTKNDFEFYLINFEDFFEFYIINFEVILCIILCISVTFAQQW